MLVCCHNTPLHLSSCEYRPYYPQLMLIPTSPAPRQWSFVLLRWFFFLLPLFSSLLLLFLAGASGGDAAPLPVPRGPWPQSLLQVHELLAGFTKAVLHHRGLPGPHQMWQSGFYTNTILGRCHLNKSVTWFKLKFHLILKLACSSLTWLEVSERISCLWKVSIQHRWERPHSVCQSGPTRRQRPRQLL